MCLAVPARLVVRDGDEGIADLQGNRLRVTMFLVPDAQVGDWILVHAGFAIQRLDEGTAEQTWSVLDDVATAAEGNP
jgi:hydrogenase expression/formation protein HypC